jgi:hypothetical protein
MEQAPRLLEEKTQPQSERKPANVETVRRSEPQRLDDELLQQIGGGMEAPRGNW